jgi:hypothetical protein
VFKSLEGELAKERMLRGKEDTALNYFLLHGR